MSTGYRPFSDLKKQLKKKRRLLAAREKAKQQTAATHVMQDQNSSDDNEMGLFLKAMADVTPIAGNKKYSSAVPVDPPARETETDDDKCLKKLQELVESGKGFRVEDTDEYMEGIAPCVIPGITRLLHRGFFSIQAHIDLHGMGVEKAREAFDSFMQSAVSTGKRGVLLVHGRGLSSPGKPVLKTKVRKWLSSGIWRKRVIAFSSARPCDGGSGATYVLLRKRAKRS